MCGERSTHVANGHKVSVGEPERTRLLGTPRRRWWNNIQIDLKLSTLEGCGLDSPGSG
jgi:hypothetical protein